MAALVQISNEVPEKFPDCSKIITEFILSFDVISKIISSLRVSPQLEKLDEALITNKTAVRSVEIIQDLIRKLDS